MSPPERVRALRKERRWSLAEVGERAGGYTGEQIRKLESGEPPPEGRLIDLVWATKLGIAFSLDPMVIGCTTGIVPIDGSVSSVSAGLRVRLLKESTQKVATGIELADTTAALEIESEPGLLAGTVSSYLLYDRRARRDPAITDLMPRRKGPLLIVHVKNGPTLLRHISQGTNQHRYDLSVPDAKIPPLNDARILWVSNHMGYRPGTIVTWPTE